MAHSAHGWIFKAAVAAVLAIGSVSMGQAEVAAEPTVQQLALQAAGGFAGGLAGGVVGMLSATPTLISLASKPPECFQELFQLRPTEGEDMDRQQLVLWAMFCSAQLMMPASFMMTAPFSGSTVGTLVGITLVARAQGIEGNLIAASVGILVGQGTISYLMSNMVMEGMHKLQEEISAGRTPMSQPPFDPKFVIIGMAASLLPVILGVLGFNLFAS